MESPCWVVPSHDEGSVGAAPPGAAHSTILMPAPGVNVELAGILTSTICPLANGPGVNVPIGRAEPGTSLLAGGPVANAGVANPRATTVPVIATIALHMATRLT